MLFNSFQFAYFLALFLPLYWVLPHRLQNLLLLGGSLRGVRFNLRLFLGELLRLLRFSVRFPLGGDAFLRGLDCLRLGSLHLVQRGGRAFRH